jgi:hypothetical protein
MKDKEIDNQVVFNFTNLIFRDVQEYISDHQSEFQEWLIKEKLIFQKYMMILNYQFQIFSLFKAPGRPLIIRVNLLI